MPARVCIVPGVVRRQRDQRGASAAEYGLLIAGIAAVIIVAVVSFGGMQERLFTDSCSTLASAMTAGSCG